MCCCCRCGVIKNLITFSPPPSSSNCFHIRRHHQLCSVVYITLNICNYFAHNSRRPRALKWNYFQYSMNKLFIFESQLDTGIECSHTPFGAIKPHARHVENRFNDFPSNCFGIQIVKSTARSIKSYSNLCSLCLHCFKIEIPGIRITWFRIHMRCGANLNSILLYEYCIITFISIHALIPIHRTSNGILQSLCMWEFMNLWMYQSTIFHAVRRHHSLLYLLTFFVPLWTYGNLISDGFSLHWCLCIDV